MEWLAGSVTSRTPMASDGPLNSKKKTTKKRIQSEEAQLVKPSDGWSHTAFLMYKMDVLHAISRIK